MRPFSLSAKVENRGYSHRLQRAITDFGSDESFEKATKKLQEHYGIEIPISASRRITEFHGHVAEQISTRSSQDKRADIIIGESDGSMVPIVRTGGKNKDRRKNRTVFWKEAKLSLMRQRGKTIPKIAVTMGGPSESGMQMKQLAKQVGFKEGSSIHGVGDGAPWIAEQVEEQFGTQGSYLIDFYHFCDYLSSASKVCGALKDKQWFSQQKQRMKKGKLATVIAELNKWKEAEDIPTNEAPVRKLLQYIKNRPGQFDYKEAIDKELPIGSGEVESAHRYIIQNRLKISGAWWLPEKAQDMLNLSAMRHNGGWEDYWQNLKAA